MKPGRTIIFLKIKNGFLCAFITIIRSLNLKLIQRMMTSKIKLSFLTFNSSRRMISRNSSMLVSRNSWLQSEIVKKLSLNRERERKKSDAQNKKNKTFNQIYERKELFTLRNHHTLFSMSSCSSM